MKGKDEDKLFDGLVRRCFVPKGFRPESEEDIDTMFEALGSSDLSETKRSRMLRKIRGEEPLIWERSDSTGVRLDSAAQAREMVEMFRARGEEVPAELEERLRELEQQAAQEVDEESDEDTDGE